MSEHTKGRLAVKGEWLIPEAHADRMIGSSTNKADDKSNYAHTVAIVRGKYQDDKANARRLAACWNNAEGMDTKEIEQGMPLVKVRDTINDQARELNAARALLREVIGPKAGDWYTLERRVEAYLDACDKPGEPNAS